MAKILIIGAGVIGSIYGCKLANSGNKVTFLAKGRRYRELSEKGLIIHWMGNGKKETADGIHVYEILPSGEVFDYILITLRKENLDSVYPILENVNGNIVFMVNNPEGSKEYLKHIVKERILLGFPGAGGEIKDGVVYGHIISGMVQPTTIGEIYPEKTGRLRNLKAILKQAGFPVEINRNMDAWLINHLAMVCPLANAIYAAGEDNFSVSGNQAVLLKTAVALKESFQFIKRSGIGINPKNFRFFIYCPTPLLTALLKLVYNTKWANTVICKHAQNAKNEMKVLNEGFIKLVEANGWDVPGFRELAKYNL